MSRDVERNLRARKWPYRIAYGPEFPARDANGSNGIVFLRSDRADRFEAAQGTNRNPHTRGRVGLATDVLIYSRAEIPGASRGDHEAESLRVLELVCSALYEECTSQRNPYVLDGGRFLKADELHLARAERWNGVVYLLQCTIFAGLHARDYQGAAEPTGQYAGVSGSTQVSINGSAAEPACGA